MNAVTSGAKPAYVCAVTVADAEGFKQVTGGPRQQDIRFGDFIRSGAVQRRSQNRFRPLALSEWQSLASEFKINSPKGEEKSKSQIIESEGFESAILPTASPDSTPCNGPSPRAQNVPSFILTHDSLDAFPFYHCQLQRVKLDVTFQQLTGVHA